MQPTARQGRQIIAKWFTAFLVLALLLGTYFHRQAILSGIQAIPSMSAWNLTKAAFLRLTGVGLLLGAIVSIELGRTVNWLTIVLWWFVDFKSVAWEEKPIRFVLGVIALTGVGLLALFADVL